MRRWATEVGVNGASERAPCEDEKIDIDKCLFHSSALIGIIIGVLGSEGGSSGPGTYAENGDSRVEPV